ncbi:uncharacterized protein NMK_1347 [Novimethylophilus kurashikiensis]|uniref:DUF484 family protein n=1 Tax=Novimethylophilus kurashikiensis TaxID=1825523 RepID=A0A2R5F683_9PROT|nr:DUF484 family protein [Novimethylophilus kurashikiensis]GBG13796.1 uncharacterized protein NMK_1347 [Novimethylophilus kurashikiensis]
MELNDQDIVQFLRADPQFFSRNGFLLSEIVLPSQHGGVAVSLVERQQVALRDKIRVLESKLHELIQFGEENDAIGERVHRLSLGLLSARNFEALASMVTHNLSEDFKVPHVAMRLWAAPQDQTDADNAEFNDVSAEIRDWANTLSTPYCGHRPGLDISNWFDEVNAPLKSFAMVALRGESAFGLLVMASEDEHRFYPEMGTLYLKRIGELVSVALLRYIL